MTHPFASRAGVWVNFSWQPEAPRCWRPARQRLSRARGRRLSLPACFPPPAASGEPGLPATGREASGESISDWATQAFPKRSTGAPGKGRKREGSGTSMWSITHIPSPSFITGLLASLNGEFASLSVSRDRLAWTCSCKVSNATTSPAKFHGGKSTSEDRAAAGPSCRGCCGCGRVLF